MPFDIEKGNGTWTTVRYSDNYGEILQKMGVPSHLVDKYATVDLQIEAKIAGSTLTGKKTVLGRTVENTFTLGVEGEETDTMGTKRKVTFAWEGDALVSVYPDYDGNGLVLRSSRRMIDDKTARLDYKVGKLEGWWEYQKI